MREPRKGCVACGERATLPDDLEYVGYEASCGPSGVSANGGEVERIRVKVGFRY